MDTLSILRIAIRALTRNKMRSSLTMLGIIIGVGAVIAMVGVGQGANNEMQQRIAAMGSNMLFVASGSHQAGAVKMGWGATKTLTHDDELAILREVPTVRLASAGVNAREQVVFGNNNWGTNINGVEPSNFEIRNWEFDEGAPFSDQDVQQANNVAVLGSTVVSNLFPDSDPLGKTIRVGDLPFKVVGTLRSKGQSAAMGNDQDDVVMVPYTTLLKKITGATWLNFITVSAVSKQATATAQAQITSLLHDRHRIPPGQMDDFMVRNLADIEDVANAAGSIMTILLGSIASVSLLVGGIGIMNIMLVSVTERTREIGIRMAVGATESDVQSQFLIEAVVLSVIGGVIGVVFGVSSSWLISHLAKWRVDVSTLSIVGSLLFSVAIGVFFGFYPARKAARLDPIEALRYE